jgi:hypothetical protein
VVDVALHHPFKPIAYAHDIHAFNDGPNRRGADDCIYTGGRAAPDQNGESFMMFHLSIMGLQ